MVGTRHCCWGECKTDSRYPEKWPESLKELEKSGQKVFIRFLKPVKDPAKCKRWLVACSRKFFTEKNVNKKVSKPAQSKSHTETSRTSICYKEKGPKMERGAGDKAKQGN